MKKTLIIVCGNSDRKYATYIQQLISAFDDTDDARIGTKDGAVDAVIWDEKHYQDNRKALNSSNYLLFVGDTDSAKEARANMPTVFSKVGMSYGWLGRHAFMRVDDNSLNKDNYPEFKELCEKHGKSFEKELDLHYSPSEANSLMNSDEAPKDPIDFLPIPLGFLSPVLGIASATAMHGKFVINAAGQALNMGGDFLQAGKAKDQQFSLLSLIMYMNGLPEFLDA
ncbi:hypothetical protein GMI70_05755 [Eggerthellaceae bacterium zg-893]|nr:hypothetical protein [Eggerthellaceae bacterium zg-893]